MKVTFTDIGPVKKSEIDLSKNLIVLCGPNNTGKTYIAYSIFGMFRSYRYGDSGRFKFTTKEMDDLVKQGVITINLVDKFKTNQQAIEKTIEKRLIDNLPGIFGLEKKSANNIFSKATITLDIIENTQIIDKIKSSEANQKVSFGSNIIELIKKKDSETAELIFKTKETKKLKANVNSFMAHILPDLIYSTIVRVFLPYPYIVPVERNSIFTFSKELSISRNNLVDRLLELKSNKKEDNPFELLEKQASRYPWPIRFNLEIAADIDDIKKKTSEFSGLANELESKFLKGKIVINNDSTVTFQPDNTEKVFLPVHLTAAVTKSLAGLVIYLKHLATKDSFIIIDEPEMNLHPDAQILMARILVTMVNQGFKVLISTHSDYIVREINNMIMLSKIDSAKRKKIFKEYNYSDANVISPKDVGAYLFNFDNKSKDGIISKSIPVDEDGFDVITLDKTINELNERSQSLYFNLKES